MGTRGTIAIQNRDGTVTGIYTHWDGYLSNNGKILYHHYNTESRVRELLALGDLSGLGNEIGERHPFSKLELQPGEIWDETRYRNWCTAYGRDRGETDTQAQTVANWDQWLEYYGQEFNYLYVPGKGWYVQYWETATQPMTVAMLTDEYTVQNKT